jgi:7-cyano-7-deazaguanine synthase in queuosine biosynthesis
MCQVFARREHHLERVVLWNSCIPLDLSDITRVNAPRIMVLTNGGVRSLVTTAMVLSWPEPMAVTLLHVVREQPAKDARLTAVRQQAAHFSKCKLIEIEEPISRIEPLALRGKAAKEPAVTPVAASPLPVMRLLTLAMVHATLMQATRIIWPVSFNGDFSEISRATEQTVLTRHLASIETGNPPIIECPVMDLTGRQIIETGTQLNVPWELSWSCEREGEEICGRCGGCRKRSAAFDAAGVEDPCAKVLVKRAG